MKSLSKSLIISLLLISAIFVFWFFFQRKKIPPELKMPNIMKISSSAFENNSQIPKKYTCDGENVNPPLEIKDIPEETKSLVLIVEDIDAPRGVFLHWLVFDIEPSTSAIAEDSVSLGIQGENDFGTAGYGGPCPPQGTHRYVFKIYALNAKLNLPSGSKIKEIENLMSNHVLDEAQLIGQYRK